MSVKGSDAVGARRNENAIESFVELLEPGIEAAICIISDIGITENSEGAFVNLSLFINHKTILMFGVMAVAGKHAI